MNENNKEQEMQEHTPFEIQNDSAIATIVPLDYMKVEEKYGYLSSKSFFQQIKEHVMHKCSLAAFVVYVKLLCPIFYWLPNYKRNFILSDVIAGCTAAFLHLPQGMAYGILASVKSENGLYMAIFPILIYFLLGTSKHLSIGTFAVISIMISSTVTKMNMDTPNTVNVTSNNITNASSHIVPPTNLEIVTTLALTVGFIQLFLGLAQLGTLSLILSDQLISGFCCGSAFHVATAMIPHVFGVSIQRYSGVLKLVYLYTEFFKKISASNLTTIIITVVAIIVLTVVKEFVNDYFKDRLKLPIPIDIIVVMVATLISYLVDFEGNYKVEIMGHIPTGFPTPRPPRLDLMLQLLSNAFAIAILAFAITLSIGKILAKKHHYAVNANQELIALGCANIFSSFFACFPCSAALARSVVQEKAGGQTQVAGLVSAFLILMVILFLAPLFYCLPKCILSAVILVALKGMFMEVKEFAKAWKISKIDAMIWLFTMLCTVILDVTYGLLSGIIFSILTVIFRTAFPPRAFLGNVEGVDLYLDIERFDVAKEIKGIRIFHFESPLYFVNKDVFKTTLLQSVPIPVSQDEVETAFMSDDSVHYIIINCSSIPFIDMSGYEMLQEVIKEYKEGSISVFLAGCSVVVWDTLRQNEFFNTPAKPIVFPTIQDAVKYITASK